MRNKDDGVGRVGSVAGQIVVSPLVRSPSPEMLAMVTNLGKGRPLHDVRNGRHEATHTGNLATNTSAAGQFDHHHIIIIQQQ
jgi:hypothetical protein